tara:strand:- start:35646 stop:35822 length:177 start_codon:yes stop_codon:yes gene_type:complete
LTRLAGNKEGVMGKILEVIDKIIGVVIEQSPRWLAIVFYMMVLSMLITWVGSMFSYYY